MSIVVLLEIQVKPEALDEMKAFIKKILPDTRAYDGCQGLDVYGNLARLYPFRQGLKP
jgi:quinol monooxygenase YgiN